MIERNIKLCQMKTAVTYLFSIVILFLCASKCLGQSDTSKKKISDIPVKYLNETNNKIRSYTGKLTSKTEKTLQKLANWESKLYKKLLRISPSTAEKLFGPDKETFNKILKKFKEGSTTYKSISNQFNSYTDKLNTNIKFIESNKEGLDNNYLNAIKLAKENSAQLESDVKNTETIKALIKQRKNELVKEAFKLLRKNKSLNKINKESYYYFEAIKSYKEIFENEEKLELLVSSILKKIPGFQKFSSENSLIASIFGSSSLQSNGGTMPIINGLAPRSQVLQTLQVASGNPTFNPANSLPSQLSELKNKYKNLLNNNSSDEEIPDFKPNSQKVKSFIKRLEYSPEIQFSSANNYIPTTANIAFSLGYKLNDKLSTGFGVSYILGLGRGWNNLKFSSEGIGFRSYLKLKIKKDLNVQCGSEWNYNSSFKKIADLKNESVWKQSALAGLSKKIKSSKKVKPEIKILYDFLYKKNKPVTQPFIFRIGYNF